MNMSRSDCLPVLTLTNNPTQVHSAMLRIRTQGQTALYDAVIAAPDHLADSSLPKKVLIVVSDGGDNASNHKLADVLEAVKRSDTVVYSVKGSSTNMTATGVHECSS